MSLNFETSRWTKLQSMHFKKDFIKHYVVDNKLYLIGCSTDAFCAVYKWDGAHFRRHQKLDNRVYEKIQKIHYKHDIVITESPEKKLSLFTLDNLASMKPGIVKSLMPEVNTYAILKSRYDQKISYVEFIFNETILEIDFYEMHIEKVHERAETEDSLLVNPIECVAKLKSILKNRMSKVQKSQLNVSNCEC